MASETGEPPAFHPEEEALQLVPETMAHVYAVLPLTFREGVLTVAVPEDLSNVQGTLDDIKNFLGLESVPIAIRATREQIKDAIELHYMSASEISDLETDDLNLGEPEMILEIDGPTRLRTIVEYYLSERKDIVGFIDTMLALAVEEKGVTGGLSDDKKALCFTARGCEPCTLQSPLARAYLRAMCSRLAVICNEASGERISLYGGEGTFVYNAGSGDARFTLSFMNTPSEHWFSIEAKRGEISA